MNSVSDLLSANDGWALAVIGGTLIVLVGGLYLSQAGSRKHPPFPPGPKGSPIIGNLRQVPAERAEIQFAKWAKEYKSDIIYLNLLGQHVIVLNSLQSAVDLLDKRGAIYNDRPVYAFLEALGFKNSLAITGDGALFRKLRKAYGKFLSAGRSLEYRDAQLKHSRTMVDGIKRSPDKWHACLSQFATRVIFSMTFAIEIENEDDPYFELTDKFTWITGNMGHNGVTVLDMAPWLQHVPLWLGKFIPPVKYIHDHTPTIEDFHQRPFKAKSGTLAPSFIGRLIEARETGENDAFTDAELKGTGGSLYSAGQDTTYSTETIFVMAMILAPDVQRRAQISIDAVTGGTRLPTFEDWKTLPIVERIVYETLRFHQAVPNGVPHKTLKEDVYRGMYIPKGNSMVIANAWAMLHDPEIYKDPSKFNPDRFLPVSEGRAGEPLPVGQFGFGRRVCPGQHLGFASIWIVVATILAKFRIEPVKNEEGEDVLPKMEFTTGITRYDLKQHEILS